MKGKATLFEFEDRSIHRRVRILGEKGFGGRKHPESVQVRIGDEFRTLDELGLECPCCGADL